LRNKKSPRRHDTALVGRCRGKRKARESFLPVLRYLAAIMVQPSFGFVILFLLFSLLFLSNSYKLWFKTDEYYQDIYNSLTRQPSIYPFREFFLKRMENKQSWVFWQKLFSLLGILAVLVADVLVVMAYIG
jgi:hypothetical protein